jgi:hypothetical protein
LSYLDFEYRRESRGEEIDTVRELADSKPILQRGAEFRKDNLEKTLGTDFKNWDSGNPLHET